MQFRRLRDHATLGVSLAAALVVAALGVVSLLRALDSFQPLGFEAHRTGAGWTVTQIARPDLGLALGDQILLAGGGEPGAASTGLAQTLRERPVTELAVLRDGALETVVYRRPPLAIDWPYLILALIGALYLLIGVYTAMRERRAEARLFYLWCLASAAIYLLTPSGVADSTGRWLYAVEEVGRALLPPLTLHLFLVFPRPLAGGGSRVGPSEGARGLRSARGLRWTPFLYLPAAVLLTLQGWLMVTGGRSVSAESVAAALPLLDRVSLVHLVAFALAALAILVVRLARHREWEEHRQLQWIAVGLGAGYVPFLLLYVVPFTLGAGLPQLLAAVAVLPLAVVPLTFSWAILRYKLWDIGVVLRETASTALTVLLAAASFALAHLAISRGVPEDFGLARNFLSFGSGVLIAGLLLPTRRQVGSTLERLQYGRTMAKRRALAKLGRDLLLERDLDRLCRELLDELTEAVELDGANLYLVEDASRLVPVLPDARLPDSIALGDLGPEIWVREVEALTGVSMPAGRLGPRQRLFIGGYRYAFPLTVRGGPVGLLVTTFRVGEVPLSSDDLALIRQLVTGAALAIENARLVDELHRQLEEVLHLQRFTEGIIESSPAGIAVLDPEDRILSANDPLARLVSRDREGLSGVPLAEILPVGPIPDPGAGPVEVSFSDADGLERYLQLSVSGFRAGAAAGGADGPELRVLLVHDVSDRVAMEQALREKDRLAALGVLAAGVAHEVNTPITGISSYAQMLLAETPEDDPRHAILRKVERQTFRAARIVNNLLDFARKRSDERASLDLVPVVEEALDLLADRRSRRSVALELRLPGEPLTVLGNDGELQQVVTNLALNAIDAMDGGGTLTVEARAMDGLACVWIQDTGPGIPPDQIDRIFEPFYSTKATQGGTGLGLSISNDIVRQHGGALHVASEPGRGTRFRIELPLHEDGHEEGPEEGRAAGGEAGRPAS